MDLANLLNDCPLVAILRGIKPDEMDAVSDALVEAGLRIIEVPLNSPEPLRSIERLARRHGETVMVGAGTVMTPEDVIDVRDAGGELIVMPHMDTEIVDEAKAEGMTCVPGVATPTEAFQALTAGADALKLFPAEAMPPTIVKAWRAVFPSDTIMIAVGGISAANIGSYAAAGTAGFGIGSSIYSPGKTAPDVSASARELLSAWKEIAAGG
ncbi:MAG: 2-dehydro-3-deoxy-6-phosphogalactonate aldolase [Hyphomicrobiaceae bacterium]